jgi:protein gp37
VAETTSIGWCESTFNPWIGCQKVSPGCDHCYAEAMDKRTGGAHWGPHAARRRTSEAYWKNPRKWNRAAEKSGARPFVFCASMADVFDNQIDPQWRADLWALIEATPRLVWLLLTKRPQNVEGMIPAAGLPKNAALGTSICTQSETKNGDIIAKIPALFHFYSMEPLLESVRLSRFPDWVIVGGESGAHRRECDQHWVRALRDQCLIRNVPFYFKQWSGRTPKANGCEIDGRTWKERPLAVGPEEGK